MHPILVLQSALEAHIDIHGETDLLGDEVVAVETEAPPAAPKQALSEPPPPQPARPVGTAEPDTKSAAPPGPPAVEPRPVPAAEPAPEPQRPSPVENPYQRISALIPADSPIARIDTLEALRSFVAETELIELDHTRKNPVFGVGNPEADLMVIGEAPGADEDAQGEPFVGRAGQLLTKILGAIGFEREDVYIANILKSRPPNNRDPRPDEVAAHIPVLYRQIALIQPKVMLCVGKTAGNSLLGRNASLKSMRGTFQDFHGLPVLVTYHPAALLRNPNWKRPTWEDVQLLREKYDQLTAGA
ncbi:MAG: hypothetical protein JJ896_04050 [Rhodothermales bacterium]|nr:hypothetical protein [Rhodothermales bacterium]MBO6778808.1 hypothetical protein [Rhodothermales bacterium]